MQLSIVNTYLGRNLHSAQPAVRARLELGALAGLNTKELGASYCRNLLRILPGLAFMHTEEGQPLPDALGQGVEITALIGYTLLELQRLAGIDEGFCKTLTTDTAGESELVFSYREVDTAVDAARHAMSFLVFLLPRELRPAISVPDDYAPLKALQNFLQGARARALDQTALALIEAADKRDIPWLRVTAHSRTVQFGHGRFQRHVMETVTPHTSSVADRLARNKSATVDLLGQLCIPVPRHFAVASEKQAEQAVKYLGFPVVVKPAGGGKGVGISVGVSSPEALHAALRKAAQSGSGVVVEEFIPGFDHRALIINGKLVAAAKRIPAHVIGDGRYSIEQLVEQTNRDPRRGNGFDKLLVRLELDDEADRLLTNKGLRRTSVPAQGQPVFLRATANISTGGTAEDVTALVHPDNRRMLERAARAVGLDVAGVDFLSVDISRSYREAGGAICEINRSPGLRPHINANPTHDIASAFLEYLFPPGASGRIPIAAVTGTNGKSTTCFMVASILSAAGHKVGLTTSNGIYVNGDRIAARDAAGGRAALTVLRDPDVDAAVLETARGGLIKRGIAYGSCDVGAVLNVAYDHIGLDGIPSVTALARCKRLVAESARDTVVLNADDDHCLAMIEHVQARRVCLVTADSANATVRSHIAAGGLAAYCEAGTDGQAINIVDGGEVNFVMRAADIPATLGGRAAFNITNAVFASAIAYALGKPIDAIRQGLFSFEQTIDTTPGRVNFYHGHPFQVLVDFAHNEYKLAALTGLTQQLPVAGRRIILVPASAVLSDEHNIRRAPAVAGHFDHYICSLWNTAADRPPREVQELLREELVGLGVPRGCIDVVEDWRDGVRRALTLARRGDLVVLCVRLGDEAWRMVVEFDGKDEATRF